MRGHHGIVRGLRIALVVALGCALALSFTAPALAANTSTTSLKFEDKVFPSPDGKTYVFGTRSPLIGFTASERVDGFIYTLSRSPLTVPIIPSDPAEPPFSYLPLTWEGGATGGAPMASGIVSIDSWLALQTSLPLPMAGVKDPIEGLWFVSARTIMAAETPAYSSETTTGFFLIDVTPPDAVTGLKPTIGSASTWFAGSRLGVQWDNPLGAGTTQYDSLSGDSRYRVSLNGVPIVVANNVESLPFNYCSFEDLPAGPSVVGVSCVDFAGNVGPETELTVRMDPDVPTITNTTADQVGRYATFTCIAADGAGVKSVSYTVNGILAGTSYAAPYSLPVDMLRFGTGAHAVVATVTDMVGRTASSSKTVTVLNLTVPTITRMSDGPDPFYPIRRDRYRDTMTVSYRLAERAYVRLQIFDSGGVLVREIAGWRRAGANSFVWNGRRADGTIVVGRYTYRLFADDGAHNTFSTGRGATTIRSYYLRRISRSRVRVVFS